MVIMAITTTEANNTVMMVKKNKKMKTTTDPAAAAPSTAAALLPDELIWEVLLRVPAKSLARFRCVCRSWNHLLRPDSDAGAAFQRLYSDRQAAAAAASVAFAAARLAPPHLCELCVGLAIVPCNGCPRFVGGGKPCHRGVALLSRKCTAAYALCNLSTGGLLRLPPCRPTAGFFSLAGVGYHAATDEYKVVQLAAPPLRVGLACHVLTVGATGGVDRGGWRSLAITVDGGRLSVSNNNIHIDLMMDPVFANGCLHWTLATSMLLRHDDDGKPAPAAILAFSLATESFATVPAPPFMLSDLAPFHDDDSHPLAARIRLRTAETSDHRGEVVQPVGTSLAELDGCLCMIRDLRRRRDGAAMFEVWKLRDYESGVWSLDYRIQATSSSLKKLMEPWRVIPICYLPSCGGGGDDDDDERSNNNKKKMLLTTTAHDVHVYEPQTATLETIASAAAHYEYDPTNEMYLVMRQESLLHIHGMEYGAEGITDELVNNLVCSVR